MKLPRLDRDFFERPTLKVAKELLGKFLVRKLGEETLIGKIVETEAYVGQEDKASHAHKGPTGRCQIMFGPAGVAYVYFIYGFYWLLNVVTEAEGRPCAVLIRAVEPVLDRVESLSLVKLRRLGAGPARLCRWLKIDGSFNGEDLVKSQRLWLAKNSQDFALSAKIVATQRIGVDYAGSWAKKPWRFYLKDNLFVSQK